MASFVVTNPPTNLTMQDVRAAAGRYGGLAKSCRFAVRILPPPDLATYGPLLQDMTYMCESAEMPGRQFENVDMRYYGPSFKLPYKTVYDDIQMTFLCRTASFERQIFDDWMETINPQNTYDFNYRSFYSTTITIYQLADFGNSVSSNAPVATYAWTLIDAFPILVNPQPVTWADDQFQRLGVTFTYSKWSRTNYDMVATKNNFLVKNRTNNNLP